MADDQAYTQISRPASKPDESNKSNEKVDLDDPKLKEEKEKSRDVLAEKLATPGALEVEDMPESSELQDRRKNTHDRLSEMVTEKELDAAFDEDGGGGLMNLLEEVNLSTRHLKFCLGGVVLVGILIAVIWGGWRLVAKVDWASFFESSDEPVAEESVKDEPINEESVTDEPVTEEVVADGDSGSQNNFDSEEFAAQYGFLDGTIFSGILIGEEVSEVDNATSSGENLGDELVTDDGLTKIIEDFTKMYGSMQVDVQALLDQSRDRQETLDDYVNELNYLLYVGQNNLEQLQIEIENLTAQYTASEEEKAAYEARFFEKLKGLDTYGSVAALNYFIAKGEDVVYMRAQYQAREKLITYYEELIAALEARVKDIELNEEALVKGVHVVDISGSDIDLIIQESEL